MFDAGFASRGRRVVVAVLAIRADDAAILRRVAAIVAAEAASRRQVTEVCGYVPHVTFIVGKTFRAWTDCRVATVCSSARRSVACPDDA
jgi:hypothetical protein